MSEELDRNRRLQSLGAGLAGALLALIIWGFGGLALWEAKTWDWRVRLMAQKGRATDDICLILVDQNSLDWGREVNGWSWPWPREVYSAIISHCKRRGARSVVLDVLFTEPSSYGVEDDKRLGEAVSGFGHLAGALFLGERSGSAQRWPEAVPPSDLKIQGIEQWMASVASESVVFPRASFPIPEVAENAALLCNVHLAPDPDGVYRRVSSFSVFDGNHLPALGLGGYLAANPQESARIERGRLTIGDRVIPIDSGGNVLLRYRGPAGIHKAYSAAAVLQSEIRLLSGEPPVIQDKSAFKDKYVFIGFSAPDLYDLRPSPVSGVYPGVEIHATLLDNFLSGDFIRQTPLWATLLLVLILALACAATASFLASPLMIVGASVLFMILPILLAIGCYHKGYWLPLVVCETTVIATIIFSLAAKYATEGLQKRFIKNAFRQYISPAVIEQLIESPDRLKLGGERRNLSIFFSDLESFTAISEKLAPETLTALLNEYLTAMTDIIIEEGGTVDKYEGDAIIAFWNAPLTVPGHAVKCVQAALRCQARLARMRPRFYERIGRELHMRIGINTGDAVVGNFGSQTKFDYTIIGDAVNLAARLEGVNKEFGSYTMISGTTRNALGDAFAIREIGRLAVVGRKNAVMVYEPMYRKEHEIRKEIFETFSEGLTLFYQGRFAEAAKHFGDIAKFDAVAAAYRNKCEELLTHPPDRWDGVWVITRK